MNRDVFLTKLADILEISGDELTGGFKLDYENWDSLRVMATIAAIDAQFGVAVDTRQLAACASVDDLLELIDAK